MTESASDPHLVQLLERTEDLESFLRFVSALERDVVTHRGEWQNWTIDGYLEAAVAWARDSRQLPEPASWRSFAEFLYAGKIYE
jgi:hypothetical protein